MGGIKGELSIGITLASVFIALCEEGLWDSQVHLRSVKSYLRNFME